MADNTQRVIWGRERDECVRLMAEMLVQHLAADSQSISPRIPRRRWVGYLAPLAALLDTNFGRPHTMRRVSWTC